MQENNSKGGKSKKRTLKSRQHLLRSEGRKLRVGFDPEANILYYISIKDDKVKDMEDIDDDIWVEYNEKGEIIGIEIHRAKELIVPEILKFIDAVKSLKV